MQEESKVFNLVIEEPAEVRTQIALDLVRNMTEELNGNFLWIDLVNGEDLMDSVPDTEISYTFMKGKEAEVADLIDSLKDDEFEGFFINLADDTDDGILREWNEIFEALSSETGLAFFLIHNKAFEELKA